MSRSVAFAAGVAAALAACAGVPPPEPAVHQVSMLGSVYSPSRLSARVGDTIRFVNDDGETHAVFVPTRGFAADLGNQRPSETREIALWRAGRFEIECVPHGDMKLVVEVR